MTTNVLTGEPVVHNVSREALIAGQFQEICDRRDDSITALSGRLGLPIPDPRDRALPRPITDHLHLIGLIDVIAFSLEANAALAAKVESLEARLEAAESGKKGAKS